MTSSSPTCACRTWTGWHSSPRSSNAGRSTCGAWCSFPGDTLSSGLSDIAAAGRLRVLEKPFVPAEVRRIVAEVLADGTHAARPS